jgi:DNA-binding PadR family transcriptional regulator
MFRMHKMHRFFSGPWGEKPFQKGDLKYIILDLIKDKPSYGYEIIRALEEHSHGFYTPSAGAVYPTLQMLEEMGYVSSTHQDGKKVYSITDEGRNFMNEREKFTEEIKSHMKHCWNPENIGEISEIMDEFRKLGRLIHKQVRRIDREKIKRIREVVSRAREEIESILEQ